MGVVVQPSDRRLGQMIAGTANGTKTAQTQQAQVVSTPAGEIIITMGTQITNTPSGTPGPTTGARQGIQFFDANGVLRLQADGYGVHLFSTSGYSSELVTYPPVNTVAPVVSGTITVGSVLSCTTGTWVCGPTSYAYQWYDLSASSVATPISGATSSTYTLQGSDYGLQVFCTVTASSTHGASAAIPSNAVGPIT